jgi:hypothetical protein
MDAGAVIQLAGAFAFGMVIGWYVYYINRFRKSEVQLTDLVTLIGVLGGGAILAIFPAASALFGAYGLGLAFGFFLYFAFLVGFVSRSANFNTDWFLDGRRKKLSDEQIATDDQRPMGDDKVKVR